MTSQFVRTMVSLSQSAQSADDGCLLQRVSRKDVLDIVQQIGLYYDDPARVSTLKHITTLVRAYMEQSLRPEREFQNKSVLAYNEADALLQMDCTYSACPEAVCYLRTAVEGCGSTAAMVFTYKTNDDDITIATYVREKGHGDYGDFTRYLLLHKNHMYARSAWLHSLYR